MKTIMWLHKCIDFDETCLLMRPSKVSLYENYYADSRIHSDLSKDRDATAAK